MHEFILFIFKNSPPPPNRKSLIKINLHLHPILYFVVHFDLSILTFYSFEIVLQKSYAKVVLQKSYAKIVLQKSYAKIVLQKSYAKIVLQKSYAKIVLPSCTADMG